MTTSPNRFDLNPLDSEPIHADHDLTHRAYSDRVEPTRLERRVGQRFSYLLPVSFREISTGTEGLGFTQDLSSRGVFLFTDTPLHPNSEIELTLNMPSEITLGEDMRVRCTGRILRIVKPVDQGGTQAETQTQPQTETKVETKIGVAVRLEGYEYLPEQTESSATFQRVSALHNHHDEDRPLPAQLAGRPALS